MCVICMLEDWKKKGRGYCVPPPGAPRPLWGGTVLTLWRRSSRGYFAGAAGAASFFGAGAASFFSALGAAFFSATFFTEDAVPSE